jgi:hypothetical protein
LCRWFDSAPGHQMRKPLILNGLKGFLVSGAVAARLDGYTRWAHCGNFSRWEITLAGSGRLVVFSDRNGLHQHLLLPGRNSLFGAAAFFDKPRPKLGEHRVVG